MKGKKMNDFLPALIAGLMFSMSGMLCFGVLISIGYMIEWVEGRMK